MKKSTIAVAALLTALSAAPVMSVAYADDASTTNSAGANCNGCKGCAGCKGCVRRNGIYPNQVHCYTSDFH